MKQNVRLNNALLRNGIRSIHDLENKSVDDLLKMKSMGIRLVGQVVEICKENGIHLKGGVLKGEEMAAEKNFENKVKGWLNDLKSKGCPIKFIKIWGGGFQKAGIPDLICCINGVYFEVEVKSSKGKPTDLQEYNIIETNTSNGIGLVLYPEGFESFKTIVKGVMQCGSHIQNLNVLKAANSNSKCDTLTRSM